MRLKIIFFNFHVQSSSFVLHVKYTYNFKYSYLILPSVLILNQLQLTDFFLLIIGHFSCFVACPTFYWVSEIINFTLLGAKHFCIPINIIEFSSGMQLSCLETV